MILTIAGREVETKCGVRFIRELDKRFKLDAGGVKFGFGLNQAAFYIEQKNPSILVDLIECSTRTAKPFKPTTEQIEDFIDEQEDCDWLFENFKKELEESNTTKKLFGQIMAEMKSNN